MDGREADSTPYSAEQVAGLLGLSLGQVRGYVRAGVIEPRRGPRGELCFSFQDLVFLRLVKGLSSSRIPPRRMRQALRHLRTRWSGARPLSGLRLDARGRELLVREADRLWNAESGQYQLDFGVPPARVAPPPLPLRSGADEPPVELDPSAEGWIVLGGELEPTRPDEAREAYRRALDIDPSNADAHVNLGCLEHEAGRVLSAERHYRAALAARPDDATAAFDLGVALEDLGRLDEARAAYERALAAEPECADAHYNLARLHDRLGDRTSAIRHLQAYRRLDPG
jgi:tetratricopeptide (TPR) repeat protein